MYKINENNVILKFLEKGRIKPTARHFCVDPSVIKRILIKNNIEYKRIIKDFEIKEMVNLYDSNCTLKYIGSKFGITRKQVGGILQNNNVVIRKRTNKRIVNENYFNNIDTEYKAYFLGLLFADGCIYEHEKYNSASLHIYLAEKDRELLDVFKKSIDCDYPLRLVKAKKEGWSDKLGLSITNTVFSKNLIKHGCHSRKSLSVEFPYSIKDYLMNHFLRGYFDGDGCITANPKKYCYPYFSICGSDFFIKELNAYLNKLGFKSYFTRCGKISKLTANKRQAMELMNYIYKDANIYLKRKHNRYLFFKEYYEFFKGKGYRQIRVGKWKELIFNEKANL